jgi:hypothetical protein
MSKSWRQNSGHWCSHLDSDLATVTGRVRVTSVKQWFGTLDIQAEEVTGIKLTKRPLILCKAWPLWQYFRNTMCRVDYLSRESSQVGLSSEVFAD